MIRGQPHRPGYRGAPHCRQKRSSGLNSAAHFLQNASAPPGLPIAGSLFCTGAALHSLSGTLFGADADMMGPITFICGILEGRRADSALIFFNAMIKRTMDTMATTAKNPSATKIMINSKYMINPHPFLVISIQGEQDYAREFTEAESRQYLGSAFARLMALDWAFLYFCDAYLR